MSRIGEILGEKYRLVRLIGQGGMGAVYEAVHEELEKPVAVKLPHPDITKNERELERFKREPKLAAATGHRGIIDIYDVGTTGDGVPFLVMELLSGESLEALLGREGRLEVAQATAIVAQILSALEAAHAKGIIHRDLKPENVFLTETGHALPEVKLLDFGTSKVVEGSRAGKKHKLTESGAIIGTPYYMAPEQMMAEVELDRRVDIYSVGVIFYEALTGKPPFEADNIYALVNQVINEDLKPPRELREDIPDDIEEVILRALDRKRERRFSSAASMLESLLSHLDEAALARVSLPKSVHGTAAAADECVVATAETLRDGSTPRGKASVDTREASETTEPVEPAEQLRFNWMLVAAIVAAVAVVFVGISLLSTPEPATIPSTTGPVETSAGADEAADLVEPTAGGGVDARAADAGASKSRRLVTLELEGVPEGSRVFFDGAEMEGAALRVEPRPEARKLRVELGERQAEQWITLTEDKTVDLSGLLDEAPRKTLAKYRRGPGTKSSAIDRSTKARPQQPETSKAATEGGAKAPEHREPDIGLDSRWQP